MVGINGILYDFDLVSIAKIVLTLASKEQVLYTIEEPIVRNFMRKESTSSLPATLKMILLPSTWVRIIYFIFQGGTFKMFIFNLLEIQRDPYCHISTCSLWPMHILHGIRNVLERKSWGTKNWVLSITMCRFLRLFPTLRSHFISHSLLTL